MESEGPAEKYRAVRSSRQCCESCEVKVLVPPIACSGVASIGFARSEEHTSELQSHHDLVCRLLLEKKKKQNNDIYSSTRLCDSPQQSRHYIDTRERALTLMIPSLPN